MTSCLLYSENRLVIGSDNKIIFINLNDSRLTLELSIEGVDTNNAIPLDVAGAEDVVQEAQSSSSVAKKTDWKIQHVSIAPNGKLFVVTTAGIKLLLLYNINTKSATLLSKRVIARATSAIRFSEDSTKLLISDKAGDVYLFDCINTSAPGKWILGHLSMVLDVLLSPEQRYIVTCDRDEKIRITNFHNFHEIECYCLGHMEYICAIEFLPQNLNKYLLSLSGDKTMRVWAYETGIELHKIEIDAPGIKMAINKISDTVCHVALLLFQPNESIFIYELALCNDLFRSKLVSKHAFDGKIVTNLCFHNDKLFCSAVENGKISVEVIKSIDGQYLIDGHTNFDDIIQSKLNCNEKIEAVDDISGLFKKKFDNVSEYFERKKRRIEERQKQNKI